MRRRWMILAGSALLIGAVALVLLGIVLSHNSPCAGTPPVGAGILPMKAIAQRCYGTPEVLRLEDTAMPAPGPDGILVRVRAASLNAHDGHVLTGRPYLVRLGTGLGAPRDPHALATDFAGTVEAVGERVRRFKVGDDVFGAASGVLAEHVVVHESDPVVVKPAGLPFEAAAALPVAGTTALQALRDLGQVRPGQKVLINGAAGGVGTFAVQMAKSLGAEVTGVAGSRSLDLVRALGADHVIDYSREDFTRGTVRYQLILDLAGNRPITDYSRVLAPRGTLLLIGISPGDWVGPLLPSLEAPILGAFSRQRHLPVFAHVNAQDLEVLAQQVQSGRLKPVIDRRFSLAQTPQAMGYLLTGHAHGKVVIEAGADGDDPAGQKAIAQRP